jgi:hypothetical protein
MQPGTQLREQLHGMWAAVAPAWGEHADYADTRGAAITAAMLELSAPRQASAYSSWPAAPAASGSPRPGWSARPARWS